MSKSINLSSKVVYQGGEVYWEDAPQAQLIRFLLDGGATIVLDDTGIDAIGDINIDITDIDIDEGDIFLIYNPDTGEWESSQLFLGGLADVDFDTAAPLDGQFLMYDAASGNWIPNTGVSIDITNNTINEISDISIDYNTIQNGDVLIWNEETGQFEPGEIDASSLTLDTLYTDDGTLTDERNVYLDLNDLYIRYGEDSGASAMLVFQAGFGAGEYYPQKFDTITINGNSVTFFGSESGTQDILDLNYINALWLADGNNGIAAGVATFLNAPIGTVADSYYKYTDFGVTAVAVDNTVTVTLNDTSITTAPISVSSPFAVWQTSSMTNSGGVLPAVQFNGTTGVTTFYELAQYDDDKSADYNNRSLPDVEYVNSNILGLPLTSALTDGYALTYNQSTNSFDMSAVTGGGGGGGEVNVQSDWAETDSALDSFILNKPTNLSDFGNDVGYLTDVTMSFNDLTDTAIALPENGDIVFYNNGFLLNKSFLEYLDFYSIDLNPLITHPDHELYDLTNVGGATPADNDVLVYDLATQTWGADRIDSLIITCGVESADAFSFASVVQTTNLPHSTLTDKVAVSAWDIASDPQAGIIGVTAIGASFAAEVCVSGVIEIETTEFESPVSVGQAIFVSTVTPGRLTKVPSSQPVGVIIGSNGTKMRLMLRFW